jgi:hypothetical protein
MMAVVPDSAKAGLATQNALWTLVEQSRLVFARRFQTVRRRGIRAEGAMSIWDGLTAHDDKEQTASWLPRQQCFSFALQSQG